MPFFVALVVIAEIAFLGKLDIAKNTTLVDSWADLFFPAPLIHELAVESDDLGLLSCEEWLEREDAAEYSRDFEKEPKIPVCDTIASFSVSHSCRAIFDFTGLRRRENREETEEAVKFYQLPVRVIAGSGPEVP
ncbi:hypothetical protein PRUPE_3G008400 [Prunus persica]|uniref:Uncharacterized protein n=1 Tax=Prunus persica TaxID=3760 RepID=A0A251PT96_PRUPE|nr:hypothetical protein PRUPE_3G008400 [Prunus persica]